MDNHKSCKKTILKKLERVSYLLYQIECMKRDDCPATKKIFEEDLIYLSGIVDNIRRTITK